MPSYKRYLDEMPGVSLQDTWTDIPAALGKQNTGYPTQKPLALLERIIQASSDPGDVILDPFCGCATACIAAEKEGRQWVGVDISAKAAELVTRRMKDELNLFFRGAHRMDIPGRTDLGTVIRYNDAKNNEAIPVRRTGLVLHRLRGALSAAEPRSRSHSAPREGWHGSSRQPPIAVRSLQPGEGRSRHGVSENEAAIGSLTDLYGLHFAQCNLYRSV